MIGLLSAVCREASMRAASDPRYRALSGLWGQNGSHPPSPLKSPFLASSLSWTGGSLFGSMKVLIVAYSHFHVFYSVLYYSILSYPISYLRHNRQISYLTAAMPCVSLQDHYSCNTSSSDITSFREPSRTTPDS